MQRICMYTLTFKSVCSAKLYVTSVTVKVREILLVILVHDDFVSSISGFQNQWFLAYTVFSFPPNPFSNLSTPHIYPVIFQGFVPQVLSV